MRVRFLTGKLLLNHVEVAGHYDASEDCLTLPEDVSRREAAEIGFRCGLIHAANPTCLPIYDLLPESEPE